MLVVTYKGRQTYIECTKQLINEGKEIYANLVPEVDNPVDPGGTAVNFDNGLNILGKYVWIQHRQV